MATQNLKCEYVMKRLLSIALLCLLPSAGFAAAPTKTVTYFQVVSAYLKDAKAAAAKYDHKRLAFDGYVVRMGTDPKGTFFGGIQSDGQKFDLSFSPADQAPLKSKYDGGEIKPFEPSNALTFECLNEGYVPEAMTIRLTNCKLVQ